MFKSKIYFVFATTLMAAILLSSCGPDASTEEAAIQTAVAQTVAAQSVTEVPPTETENANVIPTKTPFEVTPFALLPTVTPGTSSNGGKFECAHASLVSETIVDGTILKPGEQFTKTWEIMNTSTCVWDTTYKIVFWDGNILGGGYVYNLPQAVAPQQTIPISLVLTAPAADGSYRSEWKLQTPDQINYGVGYLNAAFYTEIEVSSADKPEYKISKVDLYVDREPDFGCQPANIVYTAYATFTSNGPFEFTYRWLQQDGNNSGPQKMEFKSAGSKTVTRVWKLGRAASQNENRWFAIEIIDPFPKTYPQVGFSFSCP